MTQLNPGKLYTVYGMDKTYSGIIALAATTSKAYRLPEQLVCVFISDRIKLSKYYVFYTILYKNQIFHLVSNYVQMMKLKITS